MTKHKIMDRNKKLIECAYQIEDGEMIRRITTRTDLYLILVNGNRYRLDTITSAKIVVRFDSGNDICCDCYGQHWYHSLITDDSLGLIHRYEPIDECVVNEKYEGLRIPGMVIYPYVQALGRLKLYSYIQKYDEWHIDFESYADFFAVINSIDCNKVTDAKVVENDTEFQSLINY